MTVPTVAVFDIDGVLADVTHRLHHLRARPKNWPAFFAAAAADPPLAEGLHRAWRAADEHAVVYLSGRPEHLRALTEQWLDDHGLPTGAVVLRARGDRRPAAEVKAELLSAIADVVRVAVVVDDDARVCLALRQQGFPVEQATWAPQPEVLRRAQDVEGRT